MYEPAIQCITVRTKLCEVVPPQSLSLLTCFACWYAHVPIYALELDRLEHALTCSADTSWQLYVMQGQTLQSITRQYHLDTNWRRLWDLNSELTNPYKVLTPATCTLEPCQACTQLHRVLVKCARIRWSRWIRLRGYYKGRIASKKACITPLRTATAAHGHSLSQYVS